MFGDDAGGDGETEASSAVLGGEVREEEFVFVLRRDAVAGVGDDDFDGVEIGLGASFDGNVSHGGGFQGFGGVVDQIDDDAAEQRSVGANGGRLCGEGGVERDAVEAIGENFDGFANDAVDVGGIEFGGREADELGEFVDQSGERADFAFDEAGGFLDEASEFGIARRRIAGFVALFEVTGQALGGELDGSERIFDFVSDAASDFLPGRGFLRAEQFGEVIENEDEAGVGAARAEGADGDGGVQQAAGGDDFEFAGDDAGAQSAAEEIADGAGVFGADEFLEGAGIFGGGAENVPLRRDWREGCCRRDRARARRWEYFQERFPSAGGGVRVPERLAEDCG